MWQGSPARQDLALTLHGHFLKPEGLLLPRGLQALAKVAVAWLWQAVHQGSGSQAGNEEGGKLRMACHCPQTHTPKSGERGRGQGRCPISCLAKCSEASIAPHFGLCMAFHMFAHSIPTLQLLITFLCLTGPSLCFSERLHSLFLWKLHRHLSLREVPSPTHSSCRFGYGDFGTYDPGLAVVFDLRMGL